MTEPRIVARPRNYAEFCAAIRARVVELQISYETVDAVAGLCARHTNKLLAPHPIKNFGPMTWDAVLGTVGLDVLLVENPEALERAKHNKEWSPRERAARVHKGGEHVPITVYLSRRFMRKIAKQATEARMRKIPRWKRRQIARKAARARWAKYRPSNITEHG